MTRYLLIATQVPLRVVQVDLQIPAEEIASMPGMRVGSTLR